MNVITMRVIKHRTCSSTNCTAKPVATKKTRKAHISTFTFFIFSASLLASCGGIESDARNAVAELIRDPSSLKFRDVHIAPDNKKSNLSAVCGYMNATNGFGGYSGFTPFIYTDKPQPSGVTISQGEDDEKFAHYWEEICVEKDKATETSAAKTERIEAQTTIDLSKMDLPEIIEFVDEESSQMTELLKGVTDGPTAEAAVEDIRTIVPRLNAAIKSLENKNPEDITLSIGNMRKMMKLAQSQVGLINEVTRISQIPEARAVLEKEFDKIEITNN